MSSEILTVKGRAVPLRGADIDTDRIMPARFLRAVSFEGLEKHVFEDDKASDPSHPFNNRKYDGAAVLVVNSNFGCGSSREHAPQGLGRYGIQAIVGESYSEIFQGNSAVLGIPCFVADHASIEKLQTLVEQAPDTVVTADVSSGTITAGALSFKASLPGPLREGFVTGQWNPTAMLLDRFDEVRAVAGRLPYVAGF